MGSDYPMHESSYHCELTKIFPINCCAFIHSFADACKIDFN